MKKVLYIFECPICGDSTQKDSIHGEYPCGCGNTMRFRRTYTIGDSEYQKCMVSFIQDHGFEDPTNGIKLNSKREIREYERLTGKMLLSDKEIEQETNHHKNRMEQNRQKDIKHGASILADMIRGNIPVNYSLFNSK